MQRVRFLCGWLSVGTLLLTHLALSSAAMADACDAVTRLGDQPADCSSVPTGVTSGAYVDNLVRLQYSNFWRVGSDPDNNARTFLFLSDLDNRVYFYAQAVDPAPGTIAQEMQSVIDGHMRSTTETYSNQSVTDDQVGGEPAKKLVYNYVFKNNPAMAPRPGVAWVVNHGGKEFFFQGSPTTLHGADIAAVMASITFIR